LIVEIENNGTPIPQDRDTVSLLEYGVSTDLHNNGHNGIGCNEINDIMQRYDGKLEIVSMPQNEFPVKYVLTFNRSNTVRSFKL
jgi:sensor histidine kinase regulating citrate/malate metabolism